MPWVHPVCVLGVEWTTLTSSVRVSSLIYNHQVWLANSLLNSFTHTFAQTHTRTEFQAFLPLSWKKCCFSLWNCVSWQIGTVFMTICQACHWLNDCCWCMCSGRWGRALIWEGEWVIVCVINLPCVCAWVCVQRCWISPATVWLNAYC